MIIYRKNLVIDGRNSAFENHPTLGIKKSRSHKAFVFVKSTFSTLANFYMFLVFERLLFLLLALAIALAPTTFSLSASIELFILVGRLINNIVFGIEVNNVAILLKILISS